ncbi:MAG: isopentenyl phosphate kinase family protein [Candidatus Thorarchaeota archaeon]|nr:MAG: isopentenyl phosphate kinase family protein [Candidatus Thorarchaeota archaeon]
MLQLENLVIVKLGGSVITHKESSPPTVNEEHLSRIAKELAGYDGKLIIVLGGGAHGHQAAHKHGFGNPDTAPEQLLAGIPEIRHNMALLASRVEKELNTQGIPGVVISPFMFVTLYNNLIDQFSTNIIEETLKAGIVVVIHGDVCIDKTKSASILSGDTIAKYLAEQLKPKAVFIGTNVDGVMDDNPTVNPNTKPIPFINNSNKTEILSLTGPSSSTDVTGGMTKKITELLDLANQNVDIVIFNLLVPGRLTALFENNSVVCTRIQST